MAVLREWASELLAAGIGCAMLSVLCPSGRVRRAMRVITALMFFCMVLSPLGALAQSIQNGMVTTDMSTASDKALSKTVQTQSLACIEEMLLVDANERLQDTALTIKAVHVLQDNDAVDGIYIDKVRVVFAKEDHPVSKVITDRLERAWGVCVEVYYSDAKGLD